ncbi:uncharacterized protein LOC130743872 [Lotus japonicus]|uniref:uncharacterized protein LOC130743872 n=1 Tax=Lotus japonicus TaxID=34305 RepID=UPI00258BC17F|nr:uncharacterized protein LOC130743872 [Lotus japonicus]
MVNGSPTDFFTIEKGLRQGDPLSPLWFNICVNGLSCILNKLLEREEPYGSCVADDLWINHLQFADDTLIVCGNNISHLENIAAALEVFLALSGLKVNYSKSHIFGCNISREDFARAASVLGVQIGTFPITYLGGPLGDNPRRKRFWQPYGNRGIPWIAWEQICKSSQGRATIFASGMIHGCILASLQSSFPRLFALASNKNATISDLGSFEGGRWVWDLGLRRRLFDWELPRLQELMSYLNSVFPCDEEDTIVWSGATNGLFTVKEAYSAAELRMFGPVSWLISKQCRKIIPPKVGLFVWQLMENSVAVKENLLKRGMTIENGGICDLCGLYVESVQHLMLGCDKSWRFWSTIMAQDGIHWCVPGSVVDLFKE